MCFPSGVAVVASRLLYTYLLLSRLSIAKSSLTVMVGYFVNRCGAELRLLDSFLLVCGLLSSTVSQAAYQCAGLILLGVLGWNLRAHSTAQSVGRTNPTN